MDAARVASFGSLWGNVCQQRTFAPKSADFSAFLGTEARGPLGRSLKVEHATAGQSDPVFALSD